MNHGRTVFSQIMEYVSHNEFNRCVDRYNGNKSVRQLTCWDQFLVMAFAQLTYRESLRDIAVCLNSRRSKLYHSGLSHIVKKSTLAEANENRNWRIYADLAQSLIDVARELYADTDIGLDLDATVYALDSTTIDLCLSLFPWAKFRKTKAAIKLHTLIDIHGSIPTFIDITSGKSHDLNALDILPVEPGAFIIMDRGYIDFARLFTLHLSLGFFVIRAKDKLKFRRRSSHPIDKSSGVRSDQTIVLTGQRAKNGYSVPLRRVTYYSVDQDKHYVFLTNNFGIAPLTVADLYRKRWLVELFFKWIKQHLRIKQFYGNSINSVKTQIWISISVYLLVAILKKRLGLNHSIHTILQILSLTLFDKTPILSLFQGHDDQIELPCPSNQLNLFDI